MYGRIKSRFIREEVLRGSLLLVLLLWAVSSTVLALTKENRVMVIGVADEASYLISEENGAHLKNELQSFQREFLLSYYQYSPETFSHQLSRAGDFMSESLWESLRPKILKVGEKLKLDPLSQRAKIESISELPDGKSRASLTIEIERKLEIKKIRITSTYQISKKPRTAQNPWPFEIVEISDHVN